jgi:uncharacterized repeat protein (TIGR02543 family)
MEGYTFGGWYKDSDCTIAWDFDTDTVTENITLYTEWVINIYTVTWNMNGGEPAPESASVIHNGSLTVPTEPTKAGFNFGGWYIDSDYTIEWDFSTDTVTENITLYAKWNDLDTFTVTFYSNGGSTISSVSVEHGSKVFKPTDPTMEGYTFGGWYIDSGCTIAWNFDADIVTENITLYAKWTINNISVKIEDDTFNEGDIKVKITNEITKITYEDCQICNENCLGHDFNGGEITVVIGAITKYDPRDEGAATIEDFFKSILDFLRDRRNNVL